MKREALAGRAFFVLLVTCGLVALYGCDATHADRTKAAAPTTDISVHFSPHGGCTDAIITEIGKAKKTIHVQAYSFTSAPIAKAILEAKKRGVEIMVVLDKSQRTEKYSSATFLHNNNVPVFIDDKHAIAHNKIMLIDGTTIITGSFNFTKNAEEHNAENLLVIHDNPELYAAYEKNFRDHQGHSVKYEGRAGEATSERGPPATTQAAGDAQYPIVFVTKSGKKYHKENCSYLRDGGTPMKLSEAKAKGLLPCSKCDPP